MRPRVAAGRKIIQLGRFLQSLAVAVLRPEDLTELGRTSYSSRNSVSEWCGKDIAGSGLTDVEKRMIRKIPVRQGNLLVLGVGGGREAIPFARMGFSVTGLDFIPEMVEMAGENARKQGIVLQGLVQEISNLELKAGEYAVIWLSAAMYSAIPGKRRRRVMLKKIYRALKPGGFLACQFYWDQARRYVTFSDILRKLIAFMTFGNLGYQKGDMLWFNKEFIHAFSSSRALQAEFTGTGFKVKDFNISSLSRGEVLLKKE